MLRICLIHWNEKERLERITQLGNEGVEVIEGLIAGPQFAKTLEGLVPEAVVIDLSRLPSQGRDLGVMIRSRAGTRQIPIVFVEGVEEKVTAIRSLLPDAEFTTWEDIKAALNRAVTPKDKPYMAQSSVFAAYSQKPLSTKLGIKPGFRVSVIGGEIDLLGKLKNLPEGVIVTSDMDGDSDLFIWCIQSQNELVKKLPMIVERVKHAPSWVGWPKKTAHLPSDLTQAVVREQCMALGMVDYKICSINEQWSALLFAWRG